MSKIFQLLLLATVLSLPAFAQPATTNKAADRTDKMEKSAEDFKRIADAKLYVGTRAQAIDILALTEDEIIDFSPLYDNYVNRKKGIEMRRSTLVEKYSREMAEDDTAKDEENETADFIENFWELDIDMMELKKDMFDRFEDVMGAQKALDFFAMEDMFVARAKRKMITESLPKMRLYVPVYYTYKEPMASFNNWKKVNINGRVDLSHDFTSTGLEKLLTAAEAMTKAEGIEVSGFTDTKAMIMKKAGMLTKDWTSMSHADHAREAFTMTASLLGEIAKDSRFEARMPWINKLSNTAKMIKPGVKLTDQSNTVYTFFDTAEMILNDLVDQANMMK